MHVWKAPGKILAALRNAILPPSDEEDGLIPSADETKNVPDNLHWV